MKFCIDQPIHVCDYTGTFEVIRKGLVSRNSNGFAYCRNIITMQTRRGRRGCNRLEVGFTTIYAISNYPH